MSVALDAFKGLPKNIPNIRVILPYSGKEILMRSFNTKEQISIVKAIESKDFELIHSALDAVLTNCVLNDGFNINELVSKERDILLIRLRAESISEEFKLNWTCKGLVKVEAEDKTVTYKKCEARHVEDIDLNALPLIPFEGDMKRTIKLSDRDCVLDIEITNRGDEILSTRCIEKKKKELELIGEKLSVREISNIIYASTIKKSTIMGVEYTDLSFEDRLSIIEDLSIDDRKQFDIFASQIKGMEYDFSHVVTCSKCNTVQTERLPWLTFFLV